MTGVIPNSDLLNSLVEALTPPGGEFPETSIRTFLATIHPCLPDEAMASWPTTIGARVNQIFYCATFLNSLAFGQPKQPLPLIETIQLTYSAATASLYLNGIKLFLSTIPLYSQQFLAQTVALTQQQIEFAAWQNEIYAIQGIVQSISNFAGIFDTNQRLLPPEWKVPAVAQFFHELEQLVIGLTGIGDSIRLSASEGQKNSEMENSFVETYQKLQTSLGQYQQLIQITEQNIDTQFGPLYSEAPFAEYQNYVKKFANTVVLIVILGWRLALVEELKFPESIAIFERLVNESFKAFAPILELLRFHGNFEQLLGSAQAGQTALGPVIESLRDFIVVTLPKAHSAFQAKANEVLIPLFGEIQKVWNEYPERLERLIAVMKQDQKFSVFRG